MSKALKNVISVFDDGSFEATNTAEVAARVEAVKAQAMTGPTAPQVGDKITGLDGNVYTIVPGKTSELQQALLRQIGIEEFKDNPNYSTGDREVRARVAPGEYNYPMPTERTVYELAAAGAYLLNYAGADGQVRVEVAGMPSGEVQGAVQLIVNGAALKTSMEGKNLSAYREEVTVKGKLGVSARIDGGDPTVLLVVTPL